MIDEIKRHSRNYAKRQMTWFHKNPNPPWIEVRDGGSADDAAQLISEALHRHKIPAQTGLSS
jgi:tRNA A37 N6-isopentenylltransferase MiaA